MKLDSLYMPIGILCLCGWALVQNEKTHKDRQALMIWVFAQPNWKSLRRVFEIISYDKHLFQRLILRNPWKMYPTEIKNALTQPGDQT